MSSESARWYTTQMAFPFVRDMAPAPGSLPSLKTALEAVPEHRGPRGYRQHEPPYPLVPMFLLLLIGTLCGRRGYQALAE